MTMPRGELIVQDTYNDGPNFHISYEKFIEGWRSFNYLFVVVYPATRRAMSCRCWGRFGRVRRCQPSHAGGRGGDGDPVRH